MLDFSNTIILTGAGFTANFGGFLAREMWSKIFNNPRLDTAESIKLELHNNFDYEDMYSNVFDKTVNYTDDDKNTYKDVVGEAYISMNDYILSQSNKKKNAKMSQQISDFLSNYISQSEGKVGGYFTLNQDLLPEVEYNWQPLGPNLAQAMQPKSSVILPTQYDLDQYTRDMSPLDFCYCKLHGSINWLQEDGNQTMVLGINKLSTINNVPLLKWYFDLFKQAINRNRVKLLIIGYGFRDKHINTCLFEAINNSALQLYVISPEDPEFFRRKLTVKGAHLGFNGGTIIEPNDEGIKIWNAVKAYFPYKLSSIFLETGEKTAALEEILKAINQT